jgi:hypothetical protein
VRVFWALQDTSRMVSYRWFLGMIVMFMAARLVLVSVGLPHTRIPSSGGHPVRFNSPLLGQPRDIG